MEKIGRPSTSFLERRENRAFEEAGRQRAMFPKRVRTVLSYCPNGAGIAFACKDYDGDLYYCKQDSLGRSARFNDWFCTHLARHLGIPTADCVVIEDDDGETFFGSLHHASTQDHFDCQQFLVDGERDEIGKPKPWVGQYLSRLFALDLFLGNGDRDRQNFVLRRDGSNRRILTAIDFASAHPEWATERTFPIASSRTILVGKQMLVQHGRHEASAIEMVERIGSVPSATIKDILEGTPESWLNATQRGEICDAWASGRVHKRLASLRAGIGDGSLI